MVSSSFLTRFSHSVDRFLRRTFFALGYVVACNPLKVLCFSFILFLAALSGVVRFHTESRGDHLWTPKGTLAMANQEFVENTFGMPLIVSAIAFVERENGPKLLSKEGMEAMLDVVATAAEVRDKDGKGYEDRCVKLRDEMGNIVCATASIFSWLYEADKAVKQGEWVDFFETVRKIIAEMSDEEIRVRVLDSLREERNGFDGSKLDGDEIISLEGDEVKVVRYVQVLEHPLKAPVDEKDFDPLEEAWTDFLVKQRNEDDARKVDWFVDSWAARENTLEDTLSSDLKLLRFAFPFLFLYVILFLGDFHSVRSHMMLGVGALITTGMAIGACFGLSSLLGMFYGPVHQSLPLLIAGIGIDDCFIVTRAADEEWRKEGSKEKSVEVKLANAMSVSGSSITVTSFTNVVVFLMSASSRLPALRIFSFWAAIGIFVAWALAISFYTALVTLDFRRIEAGKKDYIPFCVPCVRGGAEVQELNWFGKKSGGFSRFFRNTFGPSILNSVVRIVLLIAFGTGFAVCCYGASKLHLKFKFSFFFPKGSAAREYQDIADQHFKTGDGTHVYVRGVHLNSTENQKRLLDLCDPVSGLIAKNPWIQNGTVDCWLPVLRTALGITDPDETIAPALLTRTSFITYATSGQGARFAPDLVFDDITDKLVACRFKAKYVYRETNQDEVDALASVRLSAAKAGFGLNENGDPAAFPYSLQDTFAEQYTTLQRDIGLSTGLASVAVAFVCLILVGHPLMALLCTLLVGIVVVDMLGLTYFTGINLNSVSLISLVLATGLSVDFVVHVARSFLEHVGTRKERAIKALESMGPPVFYAGFSTFIVISFMAFSKSYIFRVFFIGFSSLLALGGLHGLVLGPLLMSLIGPGSLYLDKEDKANKENSLELSMTMKNIDKWHGQEIPPKLSFEKSEDV